MIEAKMYINGIFLNSDNTYKIISPEEKQLGIATSSSEKQINLAFKSARESQKKWESLSINKKEAFLLNLASELDKQADYLANIMVDEIGKNITDSKNEIFRSSKLIRDILKEYPKMNKEKIKLKNSNKEVVIYRKALGVVLAITPFNYPVNILIAKIIPALITGNSIVLKPATNGSLISFAITKIIHKIGIPAGVFNLILGKGKDIGKFLYSNKEVNAITFTGGVRVGKEISSCASMSIQVLELGGKDVSIIRKDADLELAAKQIVKGALSFSGQRCTAIKRVFVFKENKKELIEKVISLVLKLKVGSARFNNDITPVITKKSGDYIMSLVDDALDKGANSLLTIKREQNLIHPILLDNVKWNMKIAWEEQFGPVIPFIEVSSDEEAILMANKSEYGLQSSIFTKDIKKAVLMAHKLEVGSLNINSSSQRGPDILPFTGVKNSGLNIQGIKYSLETMTRTFNIVNNI